MSIPAKKWDTGDPTCCLTRRCNEKFDFEEATALRCAVPKRGKGQQSVRKSYVQSRIMDAATGTGHWMFLGESVYMVEVCTSFFCMLTVLSRTLSHLHATLAAPACKFSIRLFPSLFSQITCERLSAYSSAMSTCAISQHRAMYKPYLPIAVCTFLIRPCAYTLVRATCSTYSRFSLLISVTDCSNAFQSRILQERPQSTCLTLQHVDMPTATTCRCSQKEYGPGYMFLMKTWPNLADTPSCPRKVVEGPTLHQHRLSCKAAEGRMMGILTSCEQDGIFLVR